MQTQPLDEVEQNPDATGAKHVFASKTIAGIVLLLLPLIAKKLGLQLSDADSQAIAEQVVELIGAALAIYGRFTATQPLTLKVKPAPAAAAILAIFFGCFAALYLTGCAAGSAIDTDVRSKVKSVTGSVDATYDPVTKGVTGSGSVSIEFRDPADNKSIKPIKSSWVQGLWPKISRNTHPKGGGSNALAHGQVPHDDTGILPARARECPTRERGLVVTSNRVRKAPSAAPIVLPPWERTLYSADDQPVYPLVITR